MALKHEAPAFRKWRAAIRAARGHVPAYMPALFFLTDPDRVADPVSVAQSLPARSGVIYRHFGAADRAEVARRLADIAKARRLVLLIAADPKLAHTVGAAGVHWPEKQLAEARAWRGRFAMQTASAHSRAAIARATGAGMDGVLVSTVFASSSKSAGRPIGPVRLARLGIGAGLPIYGLGGINPDNARQVAGFAGLAAVTGLV